MSIRTLLGSYLHNANIELYQRHHALGDGRCAACGEPHPCQAARHASLVIAEAGEDPHWYDGELALADASEHAGGQPAAAGPVQPLGQQTAEWPQIALAEAPTFAGYAVGDNTRRAHISYATYER